MQEEFLKPSRLTRKQCAERLGAENKVIDNICKDRSATTPQIALKLEAAFGSSAEFWLNAQMGADLWRTIDE